MDMTNTFNELASPFCEKHNLKKTWHSEIMGVSWHCKECGREMGEAFKIILNRIKNKSEE